MTLNNSDDKPQDVYWKLSYNLNLPMPKVKVHDVEWDEEQGVLFVYVSTSGRKRKTAAYVDGIPLYQPDENGVDVLVGMKPVALGDPPQTLVKVWHNEMADRLLGEEDASRTS